MAEEEKAKNWNSGGGEEFVKHKLPCTDEDGVPVAYTGKIEEISEPYEQDKWGQKEGKDLKIRVMVRVLEKKGEIAEQVNDVDLPMFVTFLKTKGSGAYSNSKLYDILETADLLKESEAMDNMTKEEQTQWLRDKLLTKKCKILIKTVKKQTDEAYSVVDKITKIWEGE